MKILTASQIRATDAFTIQQEKIDSFELMERAAARVTEAFCNDYQSTSWTKHIFCGTGNNGGDGILVARLLHKAGHKVKVYLLDGNRSIDNEKAFQLLKKEKNIPTQTIEENFVLDDIPSTDVIIDSVIGTGLNKALEGKIEKLVSMLNHLPGIKISIDIPTGLNADAHSEGTIFEADRVYTFQAPKLAFLLPENGKFVKRFKILDIRLSQEYISGLDTEHYFLEKLFIQSIYQTREKFTHKGTFGHALLIAGSYEKMGAAVLSAKAAMRSGLGLLTVHVPSTGVQILQTSVPEAMVSCDANSSNWSTIPDISHNDAIGIGPGIGTEDVSVKAFEQLLQTVKCPLILDADALNILAKNPRLWEFIPENTILTPHPGEFKRLVGEWKDDFHRLELQKKLSIEKKVTIVLKGAHSSISDTEGKVFFNSTGNSGMATGGSGDVLTGIITGLRAQGYSAINAAIIGVYLHGVAGNHCLDSETKESMIASDIIAHLGKAFKFIRQ